MLLIYKIFFEYLFLKNKKIKNIKINNNKEDRGFNNLKLK